MNKISTTLQELFRSERFSFVLLTLLIYMFVTPFLKGIMGMDLLMKLSYSLILISAVSAVYQLNRKITILVAVITPSIIMTWLSFFNKSHGVIFAESVFGMVFMLYIIITMLTFVYHSKTVTRDTISAAVIIYLLLGIVFFQAYTVIELVYPGSFNISADWITDDRQPLKYFSFVTLTTLGYGDVVPVTGRANTLAILEAIIGQMYLAVMIARLVGINSAQMMAKK